jgi:hypothetical protein
VLKARADAEPAEPPDDVAGLRCCGAVRPHAAPADNPEPTMMTAVLSLPIWLLTILIITFFVGCATLGLLAARRWVLPRMTIEREDAEFGGAMVQAILVFYALAIALVAVSTWEQHSSISEQSSQEAATVATLYRETELYPEQVRDELHRAILAYTTFVVEQAWPAQARGEVPEGGTALITDIQSTLGAYEPTSPGMEAVHAQALDTFRDMVELRRLRLDAVGGHLSFAMWAFVLVGAAICLTSTYLFAVGDVRLHLILVGLLATIIGMVVVLIAAYDSPFVGDLAVTPDSFRLILDAAQAINQTE